MNAAKQNSTLVQRIRKVWTEATTMDPAAVRMFETAHVELRRSSRIWMV
jgi:hypothetical protein